VVGAKLRRSNDPLPSDPDDPRVFDQDGDGNPGVTIRVEGIVSGDMYIVQRSWTRLEGALLGDGSFGGRLFFGNAQVVLDSTSPFLGDPPSSRPLPNLSWFRIARLPEDADCAKARERAAAWR
jgi:hypothetical protein